MRRLLLGLGLIAALVVVGGAWLVYALVPPAPSKAAIAANIDRDPSALDSAWKLPVAATFRRRVDAQSNESVCGPASAANTLRSLGDKATSERAVLDGTGLCWTGFCFYGLTLDELAGVVRRHTRRTVTVRRDLSPDQFRDLLRSANDPARRIIVNFSREKIFGTGHGHFSPIGSYLEAKDQVFVLDVGPAFGPHLIARDKLYAAMDTWDGDRKRGLLVIE